MKITVQLLLPLSALSVSACSLENKTDSGDVSGTDTAVDLDTADTGEINDTGSDTGADEPDPVEEDTCDLGTIEAPPSGECVYSDGSGDGLLLVGTVLEQNKVTDNGGVFIDEDGVIQCVGCSCLTDHLDVPRIVCDDASISPGLINAHDHMGWMGGDPYVATEAGEDPLLRYEHRHDWRKGKRNHPKISQSKGEHQGAKSQRWGEMRFSLGGTTSINGSGSVGGFLRNLDRSGSMEG